MKCNKAAVGTASTLVFLVVSIIVMTGMSLTNVMMVNRVSSIEIIDDGTSATILAEGIVNSPECLLYTETRGEDLYYTKDIVDWEKVDGRTEVPENCPHKGPFVYSIKVNDMVTNEEVTMTGEHYSLIAENKYRGNPVVQTKSVGIQHGDKINPGRIEITIYQNIQGISTLQPIYCCAENLEETVVAGAYKPPCPKGWERIEWDPKRTRREEDPETGIITFKLSHEGCTYGPLTAGTNVGNSAGQWTCTGWCSYVLNAKCVKENGADNCYSWIGERIDDNEMMCLCSPV
jgi:hypothetical protein